MFLRKLIVIVLPLGMLLITALLLPLLSTLGVFFSSLLLGAVLGVALGLLLPLAGATRLREPFAHLLWIPAVIILLVLVYQDLASMGVSWPVFRLLATQDSRLITVESAFASYMITFSVRTGKGI